MKVPYEDGRDYALWLLKKPSERDLQREIGASSAGSPCTYCVAKELSRTRPDQNEWWLGARIGTAVHETLEKEIHERHEGPLVEHRVTIGELEDYAVIKSTLDWYYDGICRDWKTTTRDKMKFLKLAANTEASDTEADSTKEARHKMLTYYGQASLYGLGLEKQGHEVHTLSIVFIARDGLTDDDVWELAFEYDRDYAERVWTRLENIWEYVRDGEDIEELNRAPGCFCTRGM